MYRILPFLLALWMGTPYTFAQVEVENTSFDTAYAAYLERIKNNSNTVTTQAGYVLREFPPAPTVNFDAFFANKKKKKGSSILPSTYDLRDFGWISPVKDQGDCGVCWTFATMGCLESRLLKLGIGEFDLSEQNLRTCHGYVQTDGSCSGGNLTMSANYFQRGAGPFLETEDSYTTAPSATCQSLATPQAYIPSNLELPKDPSTIKEELLNNGAIYTNMYYDDMYYNQANNTYYNNGIASTNHAVLLAGWDDNKVTDAPTPGAWLIKNSWGTWWGDDGYFWISYADISVLGTIGYFPIYQPYKASNHTYMYDDFGYIGHSGYSKDSGYGLVKYTATDNHTISSVGAYAIVAGTGMDFEIYGTKTGNTLSNLLASLPSQTSTYPGYAFFDLTTPIEIPSGTDFYIKVKFTTPSYNYPIPYETSSTSISTPIPIETGVGWYSSTGATWTAVGNNVVGKERDICIRALASKTCQLAIQKTDDVVICAGDNVTISATAQNATSFHWSPNTLLDDSTIYNPTVIAPTSSTTYHVTITDSDDCSQQDSIVVAMADSVVVSDIIETCSLDNQWYQVSFTIAGTPPFIINGDTSTNPFTSEPIPSNATYSYQITDANQCYTATVTGSYTCDAVAIHDSYTTDEGIPMFPNPATSFIHITSKDIQELTITDITGKQMDVKIISTTKDGYVLSMEEYAAGLYMIQLNDEATIKRSLFIKE